MDYKTYGIKFTVLRYANVYGPRQIPDGECGVIPIFMSKLDNNVASKLFTYDDMPKGTTRDYVYVGDVCKANLFALELGDNEVINIGAGKELFIEDIYNEVEKIYQVQIPLIRERERTGDVRRSALNCDKAEKVLGWKAETNLAEGLRMTYSSRKS